MLSVNFYQLPNDAVRFLSDFITVNFGPTKFRLDRSGTCDIQFNGVRMTKHEILIEKIKTQLGQGYLTTPELRYQNSEIKPNKSAGLNIWYTGENLRPPLHLNYDFYLSFDRDAYGGRNIYFPLWLLDLDWGIGEKFTSRIGVGVKSTELIMRRERKTLKPKFACAFIGHLHPIRHEAIKQLSQIDQVDVFGRSVGKPVPNKFEIAKNYKFTICFENDLYPGYVTEKLLDSYYCETVPLYWGNLGKQDLLNVDSHLNLTDYPNLESFKEKVASISEAEYDSIYSHPVLNYLPELDQLRGIIKRVL